MPLSDNKAPDETSKSQRKRDMQAIQKLAETLTLLANSQLAKIPLSAEVVAAIRMAHTIKAHGAKRRQMHYIGKLMRSEALEPIQEALKRVMQGSERVNTQLHAAEKWRERLMTEGDDAIQMFLAEHEKADRQQLRQYIRNALQDRKNNKNTGAEKALFRYIRDMT